MIEKSGILYGIGVGPGDPELITMKAVQTLSTISIVFAASSINNSHSRAVEIAKPYLCNHTDIRILPFQMSHNESEREALWEDNAHNIMQELMQGHRVAFLTLGDPLTYSTFGYIIRTITQKIPNQSIVTIPGITSYQAAAARLNTPLVEGDETLVITSGVRGSEQLKKYTDQADTIVLMKAYKNINEINETLQQSGLIENSIGIAHCGRKNEEIIPNIRDCESRKPDYWTLFIAKRNAAIRHKKAG